MRVSVMQCRSGSIINSVVLCSLVSCVCAILHGGGCGGVAVHKSDQRRASF